MTISGVFKIWHREPYGITGTEGQLITGVWRRNPQRGPGAERLIRGPGGEVPLKLKHF